MRSNFDATLTAPATSSTDKYVLPAAGWVRYGTTKYVYKDAKLLRGPIKSATIDLRKGTREAERKGRQAHALPHDHAEPVDMIVLDGLDEVCAKFGGIVRTTVAQEVRCNARGRYRIPVLP